jgi:multiple sugar transport system substrate-binding protein
MAFQASRRQLLRYGAGVLGAAAGLTLLAACGGSGSASATTGAASSAATTAVATTSAATSAAPTSQAAASAPPSKGGALTLMTQTDAKQATMYQKITANFSADNGGAKLTIVQGGAGSTDIQQKLLLLISANTPPDVYWTHTYINSGLASLGIPVDVSPYMSQDKAFDTSDMFAPSLADFNIGGKQYAFPRETTAIVMVYNKTLFAKAAIPEPVATWNWQDYLTACQKLTSGSGPTQTWGTAGWTSSTVIYPAIVRVWEKGGDIVNEQRDTYTLDQGGGVTGMQDIADLIQKYKVHASAAALQGTNVNDLFNTGRIAMVPTINVYSGFANAKFDWDIQALPHDGDMTTRVASAGHSMASEGNSKDLAWSMLKLLASKEAFQDYFDIDALPVASKSVRAAAVAANGSKSPAHIQLGVDALSYARPERVIGNWSSVHATIAGALEGVWGPENKSVQEVLTSVASQVTALIKAKPTAAKQ